jgi:glycerol-3-phosphate dehydrogenase
VHNASRIVALSPERYASDLARLEGRSFDVLVVGGGIVGAGAALDAASRGLRVAVVEAQDWASGTSSRSSKLIHGGLRYLQMYDFALVREALRERAVLLRLAPHLVHPVPILYPLRHRVVERAYVGAGVLLYDLLARTGGTSAGLPFHRQLSRSQTFAVAPALDRRRYVGAVQYYDGQVDDARHTLMVLRTAASHGAVVTNRMRAIELVREGGKVVGARVEQSETGRVTQVRASVVVSATGVWTEQFESLGGRVDALKVQPSKGVHLVVPRRCIDSSTALILPTEKSVLFVLPWGEHWIIGTTDTPWSHALAEPAASAADIEYLLATVDSALARPIAREDVESVYVGLRPLIAGAGEETTKLSREHAVNRALPGLVLVSGGKYTTYRVMARDVIDAAVDHAAIVASPSRTESVPIVGSAGYAQLAARPETLEGSAGLSHEQVERLLGRYGSLASEVLAPARSDPTLLAPVARSGGYLRAEVTYAVTHEGARHVEDVVVRRTRAAIETADRGADAAAEVATLMAPLLGWDDARVEEEVRGYRDQLAAEVDAELQPDDDRAAARRAAVETFLPRP